MEHLQPLQQALQHFAGIDQENFALSAAHWQLKQYEKGEFYNAYKNVCKNLGFIIGGVFRTYYANTGTGEEKNMFFFSAGQIVVSYKSFVTQTPCNYHTESMTPASVLYITYQQLEALYQQSHQWEHFGRLVAERAFNMAMNRAEDFIFQSPEDRYKALMEAHPDLINTIPLYHIASYLGIQGPSLSRIRKRMVGK